MERSVPQDTLLLTVEHMNLKLLLKKGRGLLKYLARALVFCLPAVYIAYLIYLLVIADMAIGGAQPQAVLDSAFSGLLGITTGIYLLLAFCGFLLGLDLIVFRRTAQETAILNLILQAGMVPVALFGGILYGVAMIPPVVSAGFLAILSVPVIVPAGHLLLAAILIPGLQTIGAAIRLRRLKAISIGAMLLMLLTASTFVIAPVLALLTTLAVLHPERFPRLARMIAPRKGEETNGSTI